MKGESLAGKDLISLLDFSNEQLQGMLDLASGESRRLTRLAVTSTMRTFDITPDGRSIVFDRLSDESDVVLIQRTSSR